jgi:hypothetical protein
MSSTAKNGAKPAPEQNAAGSRAMPSDSQAILQAFLDYLPSGVKLFGPDLEMIACNATLTAMYSAKMHGSCFRFFGASQRVALPWK